MRPEPGQTFHTVREGVDAFVAVCEVTRSEVVTVCAWRGPGEVVRSQTDQTPLIDWPRASVLLMPDDDVPVEILQQLRNEARTGWRNGSKQQEAAPPSRTDWPAGGWPANDWAAASTRK